MRFIIITGIIGFCALLALNRTAKKAETLNKLNLDGWINKSLSNTLSKTLDMPADDILAFLKGAQNPAMAQAIQQQVASAKLILSREEDAAIAIQLLITGHDGSESSVSTHRAWEEIPSQKRAAFLRTGQPVLTLELDLGHNTKGGHHA